VIEVVDTRASVLGLSNLSLADKDTRTTTMYYWTVKHDGSEDQDIISYREELATLRQHHIIIESLSPLLKSGASFALGRQISTDKTWRDLNDTLVAYLQSQSVQDDKEQPALGISIGAGNPVQRVGDSLIRCFSFQGQSWHSRAQYYRMRRHRSPNPAGGYFRSSWSRYLPSCCGLLCPV